MNIKNNNSLDHVLKKPAKLNDLIAYQKDSIVSKTIINKDIGTVTLFAFDKGQRLSKHSASFDALVYIVDGVAKITVAEDILTANKGETIIMPANIPHAVEAQSSFKMLLIMVKE